MNASMLKKRIFAFAITFLMVTQLCAPGVTAQALTTEPVATPSESVVIEPEDASAPKTEEGETSQEVQTPQEVPSDSSESVPAEKDEPSSKEIPAAADITVEDAAPAVDSTAEAMLKKAAARTGAETDCGGLTISGGTADVDYALETVSYPRIGRIENEAGTQDGRSIEIGGTEDENLSMLVIKKDGTYTIRNTAGTGTAVSTGIRVAPGVKADITFAGVNISAHFPMDIVTNSTQNDYDTVEVNAEDVVNPTTVPSDLGRWHGEHAEGRLPRHLPDRRPRVLHGVPGPALRRGLGPRHR